ncbi:MAG: SusD/RagB family nutrient-binding outer membrane lipoprotein [Rikenellaceae bacterium]|nr:SusD/RagB family nutrient-binding outer membrane lipoprotein [Rikenellaceae bacterium]
MKQSLKIIDIRSLLAVVCVASLSLTASCTWGFEDINTDPDKVPTEDLEKDNMWGGYLQSMQQTLFAEDDNAYQRMDELHGNIYGGYHGEANYWDGNNSTTYVFGTANPWHNEGFNVVYGAIENPKYPVPGIMNSWNVVRQKVDSSSVVFAAGEILKVAGMHRATDMYGPLPYTQYGQTLYTEYDSQETIYKEFFKELDHAIGILTAYYTASPGARPIVKYDQLFASDIQKWIKFGNSLKLRLAMRIKYVEPAMAQQYAVEAVTHTVGVISDNSDNVLIMPSGASYSYVNPLTMLWSGYGETKMGATMDSYMNGYNDPRREKYFTVVNATGTYNGQYKGARYGYSGASGYSICSTPTLDEGEPLPFMTAAEIYFLRAEGAVEGWDMGGSAESLYRNGIERSMSQWGVSSGDANTYIQNSTSVPVQFVDPVASVNNRPAPSTITIQWVESASSELKLERIITQKWIAMYPNGQEAWSEYRRTGYPKVFPTANNENVAQVPDGYVKRVPLPESEKQNNSTIYNKAIQDHFGGNSANDNPGTKLWWDAR